MVALRPMIVDRRRRHGHPRRTVGDAIAPTVLLHSQGDERIDSRDAPGRDRTRDQRHDPQHHFLYLILSVDESRRSSYIGSVSQEPVAADHTLVSNGVKRV